MVLRGENYGPKVALFCHWEGSDRTVFGECNWGVMRSWGIVFTIAMGFLMGFVLAGVGGISAGLQAAQTQSKLEINKVEEYWAKSGLDESELRKLVNDKTCHLSEKYFLACVNSVNNALALTSERLGLTGEIWPAYAETTSLDNFKEKETLQPFSKIYKEHINTSFSFDKLWDLILKKADDKIPARYLLAQGINGYLSVSKDPHTYILPMAYFDQVSSTSERSPFFVGLSFEKDNHGQLRIKKVVRNSDAAQAGLEVGDIVNSLNGQKADSLSLSDASQMLRDRNIRIFNFNIKRDGATLVKNVQRSYRVLSQVYSEVVTGARNFGVITVSKFSTNTCNEVRDAILGMADKNISGLVLDLRDNPGGRLSEAACLTGLFIGQDKTIYSVQYFDLSKSNEVVLTSAERIYSGALAVLVNTNSASAAELFAGAIQEYRRGIVIGAKTFGKGTFQEIESWEKSEKIGYFRTKGFYLLPSGRSTQFYGVTPDIELPEAVTSDASEENNYINPIKPVNLVSSHKNLVLPLLTCTKQNSLSLTDTVISKAIDNLSCTELMSFVALQYNSNETAPE